MLVSSKNKYAETPRGCSTDRNKAIDTVNRLYEYKKKSEKNLEVVRGEQSKTELVDPVTGQQFFKPKIIANIKRPRDVWEELYSQKRKNFINKQETPKLINDNSEKITEKLRHNRFQEIFQSFSPVDGKIKYVEIDFKIIDSQVVEILNPFIEELAESAEEIDFKQFCDAMEALFKVLTPQAKRYIIFG